MKNNAIRMKYSSFGAKRPFFILHLKKAVADDIGWTKENPVNCVGTAVFSLTVHCPAHLFSHARRMAHLALPLVDYIRSEGGKRELFYKNDNEKFWFFVIVLFFLLLSAMR